jgi:thiamine biosynthesis lipoprotein
MAKYTLIVALAFTLVVPFAGCSSGPPAQDSTPQEETSLIRFEYARVMMGSKARIVLYQEYEHQAAAKASLAFDEIQHLNDVLSDYDPNSEAMLLISRPSNQWHSVSEDLSDVLLKSARVWVASGGAFDPTIGPVIQVWRDAVTTGELPATRILRVARSHVGMNLIEIDKQESAVRLATEGMRLDFGGIGKGYAAGRALEILQGLDAPCAMVDLGGDLAIGNAPPETDGWVVTIDTGIDNPKELTLTNCGVATSGDLYRFIEIDGNRFSHIVDPRTGQGLTTRIAVTVVADEPWLADALASAYSVIGNDQADGLRDAFPDARVFIQTAE